MNYPFRSKLTMLSNFYFYILLKLNFHKKIVKICLRSVCCTFYVGFMTGHKIKLTCHANDITNNRNWAAVRMRLFNISVSFLPVTIQLTTFEMIETNICCDIPIFFSLGARINCNRLMNFIENRAT